MYSNVQLAIKEDIRRTELATAISSWSAGAALAIAVAFHMSGSTHNSWHHAFVDWSVDGTGDPVEVDGTLVMPEDEIVSHRPTSSGAAEMQKP